MSDECGVMSRWHGFGATTGWNDGGTIVSPCWGSVSICPDFQGLALWLLSAAPLGLRQMLRLPSFAGINASQIESPPGSWLLALGSWLLAPPAPG